MIQNLIITNLLGLYVMVRKNWRIIVSLFFLLELKCILIHGKRLVSVRNLETESTIFWPRYYPYYFKGFCYWLGHEQQKEFENCYFKSDYEYIRELIVYFDMDREMFNYVLLPEELNRPDSISCLFYAYFGVE